METTNAAPQGIRSTMAEIRNGLRCSTIEAMFATVHVGLTQGMFLTSYLVDLVPPNFVFGLVESLPSFLQFTFILSPLLVARLQARKPVATFFAFAHRLSWMVDLVPSSVRGPYYGRRNSYLGITSMVTIFLGTQALTVFRDAGEGRFGYTLCFGTAAISAAFAAYVLLRTHEPRINVIPESIRDSFRAIQQTFSKQFVSLL